MAIGQRIKFFRNRKGMTQKQLGEQLGFKGKTSDVRMAQYESEARVPKIDLVKQMSQISLFSNNNCLISIFPMLHQTIRDKLSLYFHCSSRY